MEKKKMLNSKDLLTIREYTYEGITVLVEIDRLKMKATLIDRDAEGNYAPKEWVFAGRTVALAKSWLKIMAAMQYATERAIKDLGEVELRDKLFDDLSKADQLKSIQSISGESLLD
jgi:hypothetical protein